MLDLESCRSNYLAVSLILNQDHKQYGRILIFMLILVSRRSAGIVPTRYENIRVGLPPSIMAKVSFFIQSIKVVGNQFEVMHLSLMVKKICTFR